MLIFKSVILSSEKIGISKNTGNTFKVGVRVGVGAGAGAGAGAGICGGVGNVKNGRLGQPCQIVCQSQIRIRRTESQPHHLLT